MHENCGAFDRGPKATALPEFVSLFQDLVSMLENFNCVSSTIPHALMCGPDVHRDRQHHSAAALP